MATTSTERNRALRQRDRAAWMAHLCDIVLDAIDAEYNRDHEESAGEVRAAEGREPVPYAVRKTYIMAFGDIIRGRQMPTANAVRERMIEVHRSLREVAR